MKAAAQKEGGAGLGGGGGLGWGKEGKREKRTNKPLLVLGRG